MNVQIEDLLYPRTRLRVLRVLAKNSVLTIGQIVRMTGSNHKTIKNHLLFLQAEGLIDVTRFERLVSITLKKDGFSSKMKEFFAFFLTS